uniref:Potassium channel domain-containing protein n=1 Tax=Romanomermis culicivorax TaxID=13658 RepID=A0A915K5Y5_ROMCU
VGFGDLFPGLSVSTDEQSAQDKLAITSFYLLFGMALIAMCFNLAQEEVVNIVTRLAVRLGIFKPKENMVVSSVVVAKVQSSSPLASGSNNNS